MGDLIHEYQAQMHALLPPGPAWPEDDPFLLGMAPAFARVHERIEQLLEEADPRTAVELFLRLERLAGLPDACAEGAEQDMQRRRADLIAKLQRTGSLSRAFFIDLAAALGYVITIDEFLPFRVEMPVEQPLTGVEWLFTWRVNLPLTGEEIPFRVEYSRVEDRLLTWSTNELIECLFLRLMPAHTNIIFAYT